MKGKSILWVVGGIAAVAASAYAVQRLRVWMAWRDEEEFEETEREIERYDAYVHSNGGKKRAPRKTKSSKVTS